jgi:hypothetical protein
MWSFNPLSSAQSRREHYLFLWWGSGIVLPRLRVSAGVMMDEFVTKQEMISMRRLSMRAEILP